MQKPAAGEGVDPAGQAGVRGVAVRAQPVGKLRRGGGEGSVKIQKADSQWHRLQRWIQPYLKPSSIPLMSFGGGFSFEAAYE